MVDLWQHIVSKNVICGVFSLFPVMEGQTTITLDVISAMRYYNGVIKSFKGKETEKIFYRVFSKKLPQVIQHLARRKLIILDAATEIDALRVPPGNRLELLKGNRKGQYSIRINDQFRICFKWKTEDAYNVEITDYH